MEETDMCIQPTIIAAPAQQQFGKLPAAKLLGPQERQGLALDALAGTQSISQLAEDHDVSRKFVYQQADKAEQALEEAFALADPADDQVLFTISVTKRWLRRFIIADLLICHSSYRGVAELLRDAFHYSISVERIHAIAHEAMDRARGLESPRLSGVRIGAHDEIFQSREPVLVGVDVASTYCYLLSQEEHRDGITWAIRLWELRDRGFDPEAIICDGGSGLQAGQDLAMPNTPRRGDVFHAFQETEALSIYLENRAYDAIAARSKLEHKQAGTERQHGRRDAGVSQKLRHARPAEAQAVTLATDVATLLQWLRQDILALPGPSYEERGVLYDFVVAELKARQPLCPHRIGPVCTYLVNHRDALLAFAKQLDADLNALAAEFQLPVAVVRAVFHVQALDPQDRRRWPQEAALQQQLRGRYYELSQAVTALARSTVRASSVVENFNSRLRNYFFLRRSLGQDYLHLLQFFLNHRRFLRSEHPERVGRSPAELLTRESHPHWLDMLGFTLPAGS
jgi:uncharacterized protein (UPF0548 family)